MATAAQVQAMRTAYRQGVSLVAHIRDLDTGISAVDVVDLSTDGCRFRCDRELESATDIWIRLPHVGARPARIVWSKDSYYGAEFAEPIEVELFNRFFPEVRT